MTDAEKSVYVVFHMACKHPVMATGDFANATDTARQCGMWANVREASDDDLAHLITPGSSKRCLACAGLLRKVAFAGARASTGHADAKLAVPVFAPDGSFDHLEIVSEDGTTEVV